LDKGFLLGVQAKDFDELSSRYKFSATEELIGECLKHCSSRISTKPKKRRGVTRAMSKFASEQNSLQRIECTSDLLRQELDIRRPSSPLESKYKIWFNPAALDAKGELPDEHADLVDLWSSLISESVEISANCIVKARSPIFDWDDELKEFASRKPLDLQKMNKLLLNKIPVYRARIANDIEFVRNQYRWFRPFGYPQPEQIDPRWALYRICQARLLFHLEILVYCANGTTVEEKTLTHDWLDYQYCILGSLAGGLATSDEGQCERFRLMHPKGVLLFFNHGSRKVEFLNSIEKEP
jgi:hypothetical protein